MNKLPQVSVMLPVYNTQAFLERCLGSVFNQSYPNLQVIIVNDASPDNSKALIEDLIARNQAEERTLLVNLEQNQGLAGARMEALKHATGDYLLWLDSDDYWDNSAVVSGWVAVALETGAKLVISDYYADYAKKIVKYHVPRISTGPELAHAILRGSSPGFMWNKLVERQHFLCHAGPWVKGQNVFEDVGVVVPLCYSTSQIAYFSVPACHYVQYNESSYLRRLNVKAMEGALSVLDRIKYFLLDVQKDESYRPSIETMYLNYKMMLYTNVSFHDYKLVRAIKSGSLASLPHSTWPAYDKLSFRLRSFSVTAPIGWLMGRFKSWVKDCLRN